MNDVFKLFMKFQRRIGQLALMTDTLKVQEILNSEHGIQLSVDEIRMFQGRGPKLFSIGIIKLWATEHPQKALACAAQAWKDTISWQKFIGIDILQLFLDEARKTLQNLNRDTLDGMLPEGPGKAYALDLAEAATDPYSLANRILTGANPHERAKRLKALAEGWPDPETAADWARQNLSGGEKTAFYSHVGYKLAEQNPQAALRVLAEIKVEAIDLKGYCIDPQAASQIMAELGLPGAYALTLEVMMRGLVESGGLGRQVAELIAISDLNVRQRANLISELSRRWVRQDADAAIEWVNSLTAPEDVRAAIPFIVSQIDSDRVSRWVGDYLKSPDPVMELALIEAAAPDLYFDPQKSRLILDPIIGRDPGLKLSSRKADGNDGQSDLRDLIARRAYEIYEGRGRRDGEAINDWLRAEAEVKSSVMAKKRSITEGRGATREEILWKSVIRTAKRQAEIGPPEDAMEWLGALPFASQIDYAKAVGGVLTVWKLKSPTEAVAWLLNSTLDPKLKSVLQKIVRQ